MANRKKIFAKLDTLEVIVSPPAIVAEVLSLLEKESSSSSKISEIILKDANLTARILRIANSSFYGYRQEVTTVNQAIMIIGQNVVKCFLLSISIYNQMAAQKSKNSDQIAILWQHLIETAVAAKHAASIINRNMVDEAYVAGLLHDFGRLFLIQYFPDETSKIRGLLNDGKLLIDAEKEILGADHQEVGKYIAEHWNLPKALSETIGMHHPKDEIELHGMSLLAKIIVFADNLSPANFEFSDNIKNAGHRVRLLDTSCTSIGLGMDNIKKIYGALPKEVLGSAEGLDLNLGDAFEYLSKVNHNLFDIYLSLAKSFREREELSGEILKEERIEGVGESLQIVLATLSHYINNAMMNISGQCEVIQLLHDSKDKDKVYKKIPSMTKSIRSSIKKTSMILEELSAFSSVENINYFKNSKAIDIESELKKRLDSNQVLL